MTASLNTLSLYELLSFNYTVQDCMPYWYTLSVRRGTRYVFFHISTPEEVVKKRNVGPFVNIKKNPSLDFL